MTVQRAPRLLRIPRIGTVRPTRRHLFYFPAGLIGFEHLKRYIIVSIPQQEPLRWLVAVDEPTIGFPVMLPWHIVPSYELPPEFNDPTTYVPLVIITLASDPTQLVANLKAPVVLNLKEQTGQQLIVPGDRYSATHPIVQVQQASQG
ncbi:MAG: flagellar assembly protein FliW [Chlorobiota bacterium]